MTVPVTERSEMDGAVSISAESSAVRYAATSGTQRGEARSRAGGQHTTTALRAIKEAVTEGDEKPGITKAQDAAQALADGMAARIKAQVAAAAAGPSLWDVRPPTLREEWQHQMDCVNHLERGHWKFLRAAYGILWLPLIAAVYGVIWARRCPWGLLITCVIAFVVYVWI